MTSNAIVTPSLRELTAQSRASNIARRKIFNTLALSFTVVMTILSIVPLFWIIGYVFVQGSKYISLSLFTQMPTPLGTEGGGVLHAIQGTIVITILASMMAIPVGVLAAFYAARYPNTALGVALRFSTDVLAGVPSIVIGLFIYAIVVKPMGHYSALAGGIAIAVLMVPTITRTTEEMLKLVPQTMREASLALGAPEWKTSLRVLFPAALSGIVTGFLLAIARGVGETAPLLFTALGNERYNVGMIVQNGIAQKQGIFQIAERIIDQPADSLPLTLWKYAQQPYPERVQLAWAVAMVLMLFVLALNIIARTWVILRKRRLEGS